MTVVDFVEGWISENVYPDAYVDEEHDDPRPAEMAVVCTAAALEAGFSQDALDKAYPVLSDRMAEAIDAAVDREIDRLSSKDH